MLSEEQLEARKGLITSSNVAACLGLDPHTTPLQAALRARGQSDEKPANEKAIERGNRLESLVLSYVAEEKGWQWQGAPFRRHPEAAWAADSTDACYFADGGSLIAIGEGKTASLGAAGGFGAEGTDEVPYPCLLQSQWHLMHWPEVDTCYVPVLVGGYAFEFRLYRVKRNKTLQDILMEDCFHFWQKYVHGNELPPPEAGDTGWLQKRYPLAEPGKMLPDSAEIQRLAREVHAARGERKAVTAKEDRAKNRLRAILQHAEGVRAQWGSVTYRNTKGRTKTDWQSIAEELSGGEVDPGHIQKHTHTAQGPRVLRVAPKKGIWDDG